MDAWLLGIGLPYLAVGLVVYMATDTSEFAFRINSHLFIPLGVVRKYVFLFVVSLWPLWLVARTSRP